jgi:hypothetical protein
MRPDTKTTEFMVNYFCLFFLMIFLAVSGIPVMGYLAQLAAIISILYFVFEGMLIFALLGGVGSLVIAVLSFGFNPVLIGIWAQIIIPSAILGRMIAVGKTPPKAFLASLLSLVIITLGIFLLEKNTIFSVIDNSKEMAASYVGSMGAGAAGTRLSEDIAKMFETFRRLTPSLLILAGVGQLFLGWVGLMLLLKALGRFQPVLIGFSFWKMPYNYIYIVGATVLLRLVGTESMRVVADNAILFMAFFYAVFGLSVFEYYLKKIKLSLLFRIIFYIAFLPGALFAVFVGLFDSYFDFRKVRARIIG